MAPDLRFIGSATLVSGVDLGSSSPGFVVDGVKTDPPWVATDVGYGGQVYDPPLYASLSRCGLHPLQQEVGQQEVPW